MAAWRVGQKVDSELRNEGAGLGLGIDTIGWGFRGDGVLYGSGAFIDIRRNVVSSRLQELPRLPPSSAHIRGHADERRDQAPVEGASPLIFADAHNGPKDRQAFGGGRSRWSVRSGWGEKPARGRGGGLGKNLAKEAKNPNEGGPTLVFSRVDGQSRLEHVEGESDDGTGDTRGRSRERCHRGDGEAVRIFIYYYFYFFIFKPPTTRAGARKEIKRQKQQESTERKRKSSCDAIDRTQQRSPLFGQGGRGTGKGFLGRIKHGQLDCLGGGDSDHVDACQMRSGVQKEQAGEIQQARNAPHNIDTGRESRGPCLSPFPLKRPFHPSVFKIVVKISRAPLPAYAPPPPTMTNVFNVSRGATTVRETPPATAPLTRDLTALPCLPPKSRLLHATHVEVPLALKLATTAPGEEEDIRVIADITRVAQPASASSPRLKRGAGEAGEGGTGEEGGGESSERWKR